MSKRKLQACRLLTISTHIRLVDQFFNPFGRPARPVRYVQGCQIVIIEFQATNFITTLQIILKPSSIAPPYAVDIRSIRTTADAATRLEI